MNIVILRGTVSGEPEMRTLPTGIEVLSFDLSTPVAGSAAAVPVAWISPPASAVLTTGDEVVVSGSVRRRFFRVAGGTQSRTEVIADAVAKSTSRRRVERLIDAARRGLDAG